MSGPAIAQKLRLGECESLDSPRVHSAARLATLAHYTFGTVAHPGRTFDELGKEPSRLAVGAKAVAACAALYTLMYVMLAAGGGAPSSFEPWLAISREHYYHYNSWGIGLAQGATTSCVS